MLMDGHPLEERCAPARACDPYVSQAFRPWVASLTRALRFQRAGGRTHRPIQVRVSDREYRFGLLPKCPTPRPSIAAVGILFDD